MSDSNKKHGVGDYKYLRHKGLTFQIFINDEACIKQELKQFRFPKSKKYRIRNKWSKRKSNFKIELVHRIIKADNILFVSNKIYKNILNWLPGAAITNF